MAGMMTGLLLLLLAGVTVGRVVDLQKRIIGGKTCDANERQYHVKLIDGRGELVCGGSLIHEDWILTAAHCVEPGTTVTAILGVHQLGTAARVDYTAILNDVKGIPDIVLLKLLKPATGFETASLPDCSKPPPQIDEEVQIAGHAATQVNPDGTRGNIHAITLQCADTKVVAWQALKPCQVPYRYHHTHDNMITFQKPNVDTSKGDSGGGLVFKDKIYGVISFTGNPVTACVAPGAATNVCYYIAWIKGATGIV